MPFVFFRASIITWPAKGSLLSVHHVVRTVVIYKCVPQVDPNRLSYYSTRGSNLLHLDALVPLTCDRDDTKPVQSFPRNHRDWQSTVPHLYHFAESNLSCSETKVSEECQEQDRTHHRSWSRHWQRTGSEVCQQ